jgi:hypothetical protein
MRVKVLIFFLLALLVSGCHRSGPAPETAGGDPAALPSPIPTSTPLNDFDEALRFVRNGQFTYIWVFTRKDGKPFDPSDTALLKAKANEIVDFLMTDDKKRGVAGSNFPFDENNLVELKKRYVIEDYSAR